MPAPEPGRWKRINPYLDLALTLSEDERTAWLASLRREDPTLADDLAKLLEKERKLRDSDFLEEQPVPFAEAGDRVGLKIGAYTLVEPIGHGGMSTVWLAERSDGRFERRVAVKFLSIALHGRGEERFRREGGILGRLTHPHIAQLIDAGVSASGEPYLVLEYLKGQHLDRYCDEHKLDVGARLRLFLDVIAAVSHAHANLIVHRDIKPSNVLVTNDGQLKLLDFGIAKMLEDEAGVVTLTGEGSGAFTPQYAAPEQLQGGQITTATDVYALGVLLYQLLSGAHPAGASAHSYSDLVKAIVEKEPTGLSKALAPDLVDEIAANRSTTPEKLHRALAGDLETIVGKALKKDPRERYASVAALGEDLRHYLQHEPVIARPDSLSYRTAKFLRRNRLPAGLAALVFLAIVGGLVGTSLQARKARQERDFAFRQLARAARINQLTRFVLNDAAPAGTAITLDQLLAREEEIVERQDYRDDPAYHVELLASVAQQYSDHDRQEGFRVGSLAYQLSKTVQDPTARSRAACALAEPVLFGKGEISKSESLVQEGLRQLPKGPEYSLERAFCLMIGAEVAANNDDGTQALFRVEQAQRILDESPLASDDLRIDNLIRLGWIASMQGQYSEAFAAYERTARLLDRLGYNRTQTAIYCYTYWAETFRLLGRLTDAKEKLEKAFEISREVNQQTASRLLMANAMTLEELGKLNEAGQYYDKACAKYQRDEDSQVIDCTYMRANLYFDQGDYKNAEVLLARAEEWWRQHHAPDDQNLFSMTQFHARLAAARGDLPRALKLQSQAIQLVEGSTRNRAVGAFRLPAMYRYRSEMELASHELDRARSDAEHAVRLSLEHNEPGAFSKYAGEAYLALARSLMAEGKLDEARAAASSAAEHLANAVRPDYPDTLAARQLAIVGR